MSLIYTLSKLGNSVHPCASRCKLSTHFDISPSSITALLGTFRQQGRAGYYVPVVYVIYGNSMPSLPVRDIALKFD